MGRGLPGRTAVIPLSTTVPSTGLINAGARIGGLDATPDPTLCYQGDPCPGSAVLEIGPWVAPDQPGTVTLDAYAQVEQESAPRVLTRTLVVQPAARLAAAVSARRVAAGHPVRLSGRLTRLDTGEPQVGRTVTAQWRRAGGTRWRTLTTRVTDSTGGVVFRTRPTRSTDYRLRIAEQRGVLGPGSSPVRRVLVRRTDA